MTVKELIKELNKFNPEIVVLGEFDMDGDEFMVKELIDEVYEGNGLDDSFPSIFDDFITIFIT